MFVVATDLIPGDVFTDGRTVMERMPDNPRTGNPVYIVREFLGWQTRTVEFCTPTARYDVRRTGTTY